MFIYLSLNLVATLGVDLADLGAGTDVLAKVRIQQSENPVDRSLDRKALLAAAYELHVHLHVVKTLAQTQKLGRTVETVLLHALEGKVKILP